MRNASGRRLAVVVCVVLWGPLMGASAQTTPSLDKAMTLYYSGSFAEARACLNDAAVGAGAKLKSDIADRLVMIGLSEYFLKNYRNAYDSFRAAVGLAPTNSVAAQYYLRMRKEMDVTDLRNEGADLVTPSDAAPAPALAPASPAPLAAGQEQVKPPATAPAPDATAPATAAARTADTEEMRRLLRQVLAGQRALGAQLSGQAKEKSQAEIIAALSRIATSQEEARAAEARHQEDATVAALLGRLGSAWESITRYSVFWAAGIAVLIAACVLLVVLVLARLRRMARGLGARPRGPQLIHAREAPDEEDGGRMIADAGGPAGDSGNGSSGRALAGTTKYLDSAAVKRVVEGLRAITYSQDRSLTVAKLSRLIAREMGLSPEEQQDVFLAALVHDAGFLMIDERELQWAIHEQNATRDAEEVMRRHVELGPEYFRGCDLPGPVRDALLYHHERLDGSGYPGGLRGDRIPMIARIIAVAESYVALLSGRGNRRRSSMAAALQEIRRGGGRTYDPFVVAALGRIAERMASARSAV